MIDEVHVMKGRQKWNIDEVHVMKIRQRWNIDENHVHAIWSNLDVIHVIPNENEVPLVTPNDVLLVISIDVPLVTPNIVGDN